MGGKHAHLEETMDEFLFEEEDFVETAMQEEYDEFDVDDIRVEEKMDFKDTDQIPRPMTPNNTDISEDEDTPKGNTTEHFNSTDAFFVQDASLLTQPVLRASKSMPQIQKELKKNGFNF